MQRSCSWICIKSLSGLPVAWWGYREQPYGICHYPVMMKSPSGQRSFAWRVPMADMGIERSPPLCAMQAGKELPSSGSSRFGSKKALRYPRNKPLEDGFGSMTVVACACEPSTQTTFGATILCLLEMPSAEKYAY